MTNRWTFDNDELFELVRNGRKCGTCGRYSDASPMANVGEIQEIFNSHGEIIRIQITSVRKCRFCDIDDTWARTEGEGNLSLEYWREVHIDFFNKYYPDFQETDWLELNEFKVIKIQPRNLQIRDAIPADANAIYNIWANGWRYAYQNILSADFLAQRVSDEVVANKIAKFPERLKQEIAQGNIFKVLTDDNCIIGYINGGVPESPECNADRELYSLYIDTKYIGNGIGKLLLQTFVQEMLSQGAKTFGLMCFSANHSMGFYKKMGGKVTIERPSSEKFECTMGSFLEFDIADVLVR